MRKHSIYPGVACFTTHVITNHIPIFCRPCYSDVIVQALIYMRKQNAVPVYGFVIMPNHLHLLTGVPSAEQLHDSLIAFRKFTAKNLVERLKLNFETWALAGLQAGQKDFSVYEVEFHPKDASQHDVFYQKLEYIHMNPVRAGFVSRPEDWLYSSARSYRPNGLPCVMEVDTELVTDSRSAK
jgi:putative transposase